MDTFFRALRYRKPRSARRAVAAGFGAFLLLPALSSGAAPNAAPSSFLRAGGVTYTVLPQSLAVLRRGAQASVGLRQSHGQRQLIQFPTQIQHVVVIDMENRTPDNLFAAYYGSPWRGGPLRWQNVMSIANPAGPPALTPNPLATADASEAFDPDHEHDSGFLQETLNGFGSESLGCHLGRCLANATAYSYVPLPNVTNPGVDAYAQLMQRYASADDVFQANQGPSMPSHQYLIAGQSGAIAGSSTAPLGIASNPGSKNSDEDVAGNFAEVGEQFADAVPGSVPYCAPGPQPSAPALNLSPGFNEPEFTKNNPELEPCESYAHGTILDEVYNSQKTNPSDFDWQYISAKLGGFWAAPTAVANLYRQYQNSSPNQASFAVDPNAYNFVRSLAGKGNPQRPFAALTFVTPCYAASDHPNPNAGYDYGPQWLGTVVNAIGNSPYWRSTAIIVTWDDWGGWYDHVGYVESVNNPYGNPLDPNEWGFRVPFIVISPFVTQAGYVSHGPNGGTLRHPVPRSQSAILQFIETVFGLPSLGTDDSANDPNDNLMDMFDFRNSLPYQSVNTYGYTLTNVCSTF